MLSIVLSGLLFCPAYAELPQPRVGLTAAYSNADNPDTALGIGERIERVGPRGVESVQYIIPPGQDAVPGRRLLSAVGGLLVLEDTPVSGGSTVRQQVNARDIERVANLGPGEEVRFTQNFPGGAGEVTVRFEGCEQFNGEDVSVYAVSTPREVRTAYISHQTGWWVRSRGARSELVRTSERF